METTVYWIVQKVEGRITSTVFRFHYSMYRILKNDITLKYYIVGKLLLKVHLLLYENLKIISFLLKRKN